MMLFQSLSVLINGMIGEKDERMCRKMSKSFFDIFVKKEVHLMFLFFLA